MNASVLLMSLALVAAAPPADGVLTKEQAMEKVRATLNASGSAIDACNKRYHTENPDTRGVAKVVVKVGDSGAVSKARVDTRLVGARHLRLCLEGIAKRWRFPRPSKPDQEFSLEIPVGTGGKFYIPGPNEKPKEPQAEKRDGFIQFQPNFSFRGPQE